MKTVLIIGMGRFGHHLANNMISLGNEVMIVDKDESRLEDLTKLISNIKIGDCTNEDVGADEVIYPNRDSAEKLAVRVSNDNLYDYVELDNEYFIYEIPALRQWLGKTIKQINIRAAFHIYIIGIKKDNKTDFLPSVDYVFNIEDHLLVIGKKKDVDMILKCMS